MSFVSDFHFLRPWMLVLLCFPILGYWLYFKGIKGQSTWEKVCDKKLLNFLLIKGSARQRKSIAHSLLLSMIVAVVALSGPTWQKRKIDGIMPENPVMIVLNLSSDMLLKDVTPSRLERAKYKINDFLPLLKNPQSGIVVYAQEPFLITPLTQDVSILQNLLPALDFDIMPVNGDRLDRAIAFAVQSLKNSGFSSGNLVVLAPDCGQAFDKTLKAAQNARKQGYAVNVLEINTKRSEKLKLIAQNGGGVYLPYSPQGQELEDLAQKLNGTIHNLKQIQNLQNQWIDFGYYLLFIPFLGCLLLFRRGILWGIFLASLVYAFPSQAGFWLTNNQEAQKDFNQKDYENAAEKFENSSWKASSFYRLGDYEKAALYFSKNTDIEGLYNLGNALAKSGKIAEAIQKYEEVLKKNPQHEDAKFNLEYLQKQQQQQQQQNSSEQKNSDNNSSEKKSQNEQSSDEKSNQSEGSQNSEASAQEKKDMSSEQQNQSSDKSSPQKSDLSKERSEAGAQESNSSEALPQNGDSEMSQTEQEQALARALKYREIPENPGGLLKSFIQYEYMKKRYQ